MLKQRLNFYFRHLRFNLRGGFLIRPLLIALFFGLLGGFLSAWEELHPGYNTLAPAYLFPSYKDPQIAHIILSSIATSVMTVVAIVFSILLMTLTLASMQFSPRIIVTFVNDRITQNTLGIYLGTFLYCIAALPAARSVPNSFSPVLTVFGSMLMAVACVGWLLFFINHISRSISVNYIVDRVARETESMINIMMPKKRQPDYQPYYFPEAINQWDAPVLSVISGYINTIDTKRLVTIAKSNRLSIRVLRRVGHFVPAGIPLLTVTKAKRLTPDLSEELRQAFDFGPTRTLEQDVEFGILQIVDIALKAISPAVNDPSTAICCVDQLTSILINIASREKPHSQFYDPPGTLRVSIPYLGFDRLVESAFEQIRSYAKTDVAVSLRLMRAFTDITYTLPQGEERKLMVNQGRHLIANLSTSLDESVLVEMKSRMVTLEKLAEIQ